jgi:hypothetical protein
MGGQLGDGYTASSILNDQYYLLALTTLGSSTIGSANNGDYGVDILELTDGNGNPAQNQLVLTGTTPHGNDLPVPDNYTTVIWFGASLGGLILIQSRQRQLVAKRN